MTINQGPNLEHIQRVLCVEQVRELIRSGEEGDFIKSKTKCRKRAGGVFSGQEPFYNWKTLI
jgi:hypothetical protein